ncbi:MAG: hypothetical protein WCJ30_25305 [Deltaproteobacteria bacterium]|jgi:hypothetical protein
MSRKTGSETSKWAGKKGDKGRAIARRNQIQRKLERQAANDAVPF